MKDMDAEQLGKAIGLAMAEQRGNGQSRSWFTDNKMLGVVGAALIALIVFVFQGTTIRIENSIKAANELSQKNSENIQNLTVAVDRLVTWSDNSQNELSRRSLWMDSVEEENERSRMTDLEQQKEIEVLRNRIGK